MDWNVKNEYEEWNSEISNKEKKEALARRIASLVKDGDTIGFGSGSTSYLAIKEIAKRINQEKINIVAVPTSYEIKLLCSSLGIQTASILEKKPDWSFDGADEVNISGWLIKGRGAAMFKEKLNIQNSKKVYILVDDSKFVNKLGEKFSIPIECYPEALNHVRSRIEQMGATCTLRLAKEKDGPVITENGNFILEAKFENITENLERDLKLIAGVIETGLFIGYNNIEIVK